jgi:crotonobetainyl-CoA:carnitine CoA-transferase CaiB-like acyl-CoA transferase
MMAHTLDEIVTLAQQVRAPVAAVKSLSQLLTDPHLVARSFWRTAEGDTSGLKYPGPPFRMSAHAWRLEAAPQLAQDGALAIAITDGDR